MLERRPSALGAVLAIGLNTFREAIRDRVLYLLLVFALIIIGVSRLLSLLTVGDEDKIIKDVGLSAISLFGVLTAVFVGVSLVFKEIERRTVYTLLAQPVRRSHFVVGKFVGLLTVLLLNVVLMSAGLFALLIVRGESPWALLPALLLIGAELAIVTAFALLFSALTNPVLASVWTFVTYVAGHLSWSLLLLQDKIPEGIGRWICNGLYWVLPNLERLNLKAQVVHGQVLPEGYVGWALLYGLAYVVAVIVLASWAFSRKEFI